MSLRLSAFLTCHFDLNIPQGAGYVCTINSIKVPALTHTIMLFKGTRLSIGLYTRRLKIFADPASEGWCLSPLDHDASHAYADTVCDPIRAKSMSDKRNTLHHGATAKPSA